MPRAANGDVDVYYEVDGPVDARTVALVEGLGYGRWMWRWQREPLAEDFEILGPDNQGTGRSDVPEGPYSIDAMTADPDQRSATTSNGLSRPAGRCRSHPPPGHWRAVASRYRSTRNETSTVVLYWTISSSSTVAV